MSTLKRNCTALILAAGKGTRMKSDLPKVLHPLMGKPLVTYVIEACQKAGAENAIIVIGHQAERVMATLGDSYQYVEQKEQLGTGHAVMVAEDALKNYEGDVLILAGDTPFLTGEIIAELIKQHQNSGAAATLMTAMMDPPLSYGRIVRNEHGRVCRIVEARDASPEECEIIEVNTSHYCIQAEKLFPCLKRLRTDNDQGEYYLTDIIRMLAGEGEKIESLTSDDPAVLMGINSRSHLAEAHQILGNEVKNALMENGVSLLSPETAYIEPNVTIGNDTVIWPNTILLGTTVIGASCTIGPNVKLKNARIGDNCTVEFSVVENRKMENGTKLGPFEVKR